MAVYKCKMCGGTLEIGAQSVATCEYCGTQQTLPKLSDERRIALYERAGHFLRNNEFDKATGIYEQILNEDQTDAEAYWSLVLCRFGIEYVEDPATRRRIPTVNRAQFTSVFDDDNYRSALQHADSAQRQLYEAEAKTINDIQRGILSISQREEPFDVFICYKETDKNGRRTPDSVLANELYHQLTQEGFKVFFSRITLEDKLGVAYEPYIFAALNSSKVMVVLGTRAEYFQAVWVKNEWSRYLTLIKNGAKKILIPAYRDMDPYDLPEEFSHLQAQDMSRLGFMQDLIRGIKKITYVDEPKPQIVKETVVATPGTNTSPLLRRVALFLEDGEWERADDFCEQILNMEPECAEGYLGKLMVQLHVHTKEDLKNCAEPFDNSNHYRKIIRFADDNLREELTGYIDFINTRNENARLEKLYQQAVVQLENANSEDTFKAVSKLFAAISGYKDASSLEKQCLAQAENSRLDVLYTASKKLMTGDEISAYQKAIAQFEALGDWRDSSAQIEACHRKIREIKAENERQRLEKLYREASNALERANNEAACKAASQLFAILGDYKDSAAMVAKCHEKAEAIRKDALYDAAKKLMTGNEPDNYRKAIRQFEELGSWRDSEKQILACVQKIEEIEARAEKQRLEKIRQEQQRLEKLYQDARRTLEKANSAERFKAASGMFAAISGYKDSADLSQQCLEKAEEAEKNARYTSAKKLMSGKNPNYEEAILRFEELDGWRDSNEQIELCLQRIARLEETKTQPAEGSKKRPRTAIIGAIGVVAVAALVLVAVILPRAYQKACVLMDSGSYQEAIVAFEALNGYKDSEEQIEACETSLRYEEAVQLMEEGQYDEAAAIFETLSGYKDSANRIETCETAMNLAKDMEAKYTKALELVDAGDWEEAIVLLEELQDYGNSVELLREAYYYKGALQKQSSEIIDAIQSFSKAGDYQDAKEQAAKLRMEYQTLQQAVVSVGSVHTVALKADGTVVATKSKGNVAAWRNIVAVSAGGGTTLGLKQDGTVVSDGYLNYVQSEIAQWRDITAVAAADYFAVGLKQDGTVVVAGFPYKNHTYETWKDIVAISIRGDRMVALSADGNVYQDCIQDTREQDAITNWDQMVAVSVGEKHTVALRRDGTVDAVGRNDAGQLDVQDWTDIVAIAADDYCTLGLKADGTVVSTGDNMLRNVQNIVAISARGNAIVAVKADGSVVSAGHNAFGQRNVESWRSIKHPAGTAATAGSNRTVPQRKSIAVGMYHSVGVKTDGTVVATGRNHEGQCNVQNWRNVVAVSASGSHTVGLKADGTVVATGRNHEGQCDIQNWRDVVAVFAIEKSTVGLKADGTVLFAGRMYMTDRASLIESVRNPQPLEPDVVDISGILTLKTDGTVVCKEYKGYTKYDGTETENWTDIVAIAAEGSHALGLKADGTVVAVGSNGHGMSDVQDWTDIQTP